jgi:hypothetical protein
LDKEETVGGEDGPGECFSRFGGFHFGEEGLFLVFGREGGVEAEEKEIESFGR